MLLPTSEHDATAIRGVPLVGAPSCKLQPGTGDLSNRSKAVIQACNWCYSVLAKVPQVTAEVVLFHGGLMGFNGILMGF